MCVYAFVCMWLCLSCTSHRDVCRHARAHPHPLTPADSLLAHHHPQELESLLTQWRATENERRSQSDSLEKVEEVEEGQAEGPAAMESAGLNRNPHPTVCALAERLDAVHVQCLEKCEHGHIETVERLLSPDYPSRHWALPCPQCVACHRSPPFCFSREECACKLQADVQSLSSVHLECPYCTDDKRDPLVRVLDALTYDIVVSYELGVQDAEEGTYPIKTMVDGLETLLQLKADVLCWVR